MTVSCRKCGRVHTLKTQTGATLLGHVRIKCDGIKRGGFKCENVIHYRPKRQAEAQAKDAANGKD